MVDIAARLVFQEALMLASSMFFFFMQECVTVWGRGPVREGLFPKNTQAKLQAILK